jgi:histidyl-tRNA synthetase
MPLTGTALGLERIVDLMDLLNLYPPDVTRTVVQVLVTVFGPETQADALRLANELRAAGIHTEAIMQTNRSISKQIQYADRKGAQIVAFLGSEEIKNGVVKFKRLRDGQEIVAPRLDAARTVRELLNG